LVRYIKKKTLKEKEELVAEKERKKKKSHSFLQYLLSRITKKTTCNQIYERRQEG
jgi:hypothetical protein